MDVRECQRNSATALRTRVKVMAHQVVAICQDLEIEESGANIALLKECISEMLIFAAEYNAYRNSSRMFKDERT